MADAWPAMYATLKRIADGERWQDMEQGELLPLIEAGFIVSLEQTKPCRACGTPQHDFRYMKITGGGRAFMAAAEACEKARDGRRFLATDIPEETE